LAIELPRPLTGSLRTMPRIDMLYLSAEMPAWLAFRIIWQMSSMARSRSGLLPSMIAGYSDLSISTELSGSGSMSRCRPNDSTRSRSRLSPSTDHFSSRRLDGSELQMCSTPNAEYIWRKSSVA
jgi:hypothetical protein